MMLIRSKKIRESARGQECQVRLPGICNFNPETTIFAHIGSGGGMGSKVSDIHGTYCCSSCHDELDRRTRIMDAETAELFGWHGVQRTQEILCYMELIKVA